MKKFKLKDKVIVLSGKNKGKTGEIKKINWNRNTLIVDGVNTTKKVVKRPDGSKAYDALDLALHLSKIALLNEKTGKGSRSRILTKGDKKVVTLVSARKA